MNDKRLGRQTVALAIPLVSPFPILGGKFEDEGPLAALF